MLNKTLFYFLITLGLNGCSVLAYTPVVATSSLGLNKTDLSQHIKYQEYIQTPLLLSSIDNKPWQLKKFKDGRYHIELKSDQNRKETICSLNEGIISIDSIFEDSINGGIFYSAKVTCEKETYNVPLNPWFKPLEQSIQFME